MFNDHETGDGEAFCRAARKHGLEGPCRSAPIGRGAWIKTKCLSRAESVVVGWTGPEGSRPFLGTLLLGYFDNDGRLLYAGRVGTGMSQKTLALLHRRLKPLVIRAMPLAAEGDALRRQACAVARALGPAGAGREIAYLSWADDGLLCHTVFVASREDKPASEARREKPA